MRNVFTRYFFLLLGIPTGSLFAQNASSPIDTATEARYRYVEERYVHTEIDQGLTIENLSFEQREQLAIKHEKAEFCTGINASNQPFFQIKHQITAEPEQWMSTPALQIITPTKSEAYSNNELIYSYPHQPDVLQDISEETNLNANYGFKPVMTFFPSIHDEFVEQAILNGVQLTETSATEFQLVSPTYSMTVNTSERTISTVINSDDKVQTMFEKYTLYAPYGYVLTFSEKRTRENNATAGITMVERSTYSNHAIEDPYGHIEKYTDLTHIEVFPNPVGDEYEVLLQGLPEAEVSLVQIRDYMGNLVATHTSPSVYGDLVHLNAANYPSGIFIIQVYTNQGIYTETITK
jgi:hypothetical protein